MNKFLLSLVLTGIFLVPVSAHALTTIQIESILNILRVFNANTETIEDVSAALGVQDEISPIDPNATGRVTHEEEWSLTATVLPRQIEAGDAAVITWSGTKVNGCRIFEGSSESWALDDEVVLPDQLWPRRGSLEVSPAETTTYTVSCRSATERGVIEQRVRVVVEEQVSGGDTAELITGNNLYSADIVIDGGETWVYFGGWLNDGEVHDNIYRAVCDADLMSCGTPEVVLEAQDYGFDHLNDPTVVEMPGGYYIMYMTVLPDGDSVNDAANNDIYYATSWVGDGINWSQPALLVESNWLPSATLMSNGHVALYSNDAGDHGTVEWMDMGPSGIGLLETKRVDYGLSDNTNYSNVDVHYDGNVYRIAAERIQTNSVVDLFVSDDGVAWERTGTAVAKPDGNQYRVGTPALHPEDDSILLYGATEQSDSQGFKIWRTDIGSQVSFGDRVKGVMHGMASAIGVLLR